MGLDAVVLISSNKGDLQKTPWKHDRRALGHCSPLLDDVYIGRDKVTLQKNLRSMMS